MFMKNLVVSLIVLTTLVGAIQIAQAQDKRLTGYLIDTLCANSHKEDSKARVLRFLETHTRSCALMPDCKSSGFSLYTDGKWYKLDDKGAALAEQFIKDAKEDRNFYVEVDGTLANGIVKTTKITGATPEN